MKPKYKIIKDLCLSLYPQGVFIYNPDLRIIPSYITSFHLHTFSTSSLVDIFTKGRCDILYMEKYYRDARILKRVLIDNGFRVL